MGRTMSDALQPNRARKPDADVPYRPRSQPGDWLPWILGGMGALFVLIFVVVVFMVTAKEDERNRVEVEKMERRSAEMTRQAEQMKEDQRIWEKEERRRDALVRLKNAPVKDSTPEDHSLIGTWKLVDDGNDKGKVPAILIVTASGARWEGFPENRGKLVGVVGQQELWILWANGVQDILRREKQQFVFLNLGDDVSWDNPPRFQLRAIRISSRIAASLRPPTSVQAHREWPRNAPTPRPSGSEK
jgi:hypothetical protein